MAKKHSALFPAVKELTTAADMATSASVKAPMANSDDPAAQSATALSAHERKRLAECEAKISAGLRNFYDLGRAIREVRDGRLYRETHASIEEYGEERWEIRRAYLYQLIASADVHDTLKGVTDVLPANEYQTRQLAPLSEENQQLVWKHVVDTAGTAPITAKAIKATITEMFPTDEDDGDSGPLFDCKALSEMPTKLVKLLIVSDIITDNPAVAADKLRDVLAHSALTWAPDCHLLVVSRCADSRALKAAIEEYSFELGISMVWEQPTIRRPVNWSFSRSEIEIMHARCGQAKITEALSNLINCGEGDQGEELPFALAQLLIKSTTQPGDLVATAGGLATIKLAAEQLGRAVLSIRPEADDNYGLAA